jgi:uncharacterized protein (TIGR03067 family)
MKRLSYLAAPLAVALIVFSTGFAVGEPIQSSKEPKSDDAQAESSIVGTWHAISLSMSSDEGGRRFIPAAAMSGGKHVVLNVIVTDKNFTLKLGDKVIAEMTYTADPKADPPTIDVKSSDGPLLGIYELDDNGRLKIRLDDAARGRPKDFENKSRGLEFNLMQGAANPIGGFNPKQGVMPGGKGKTLISPGGGK